MQKTRQLVLAYTRQLTLARVLPRVLAFFLLACLLSFLSPSLASAQNVNQRYDNVVWTTAYIAGQLTYVPVPGAQVQVCLYPANAVPCTNLAPIFVGPTILGGNATDPVQADQYGNFGFWAAAGYYQYTVTNALGQSAGPYSFTLGGSGGSSAAYALFPSTPGIVFSTSTTASTSATSSQIVSALNTSPTSQLATSLIPPLPSLIPSTSNVLKGSGVAGSALAAVPGTDYLAPGALPSSTTATTQSPGDATTSVATDAFVLAALPTSLPPSGACGGSLAGTFPNCTLAASNDDTVSFVAPITFISTITAPGGISANGITSPTASFAVLEAGSETVTGVTASAAYGQTVARSTGGTCAMIAGTTCTITLGHTYATPVCTATEQGTGATVIAAACGVSGTTVTVTAAASNSATWGAFVFGNPN